MVKQISGAKIFRLAELASSSKDAVAILQGKAIREHMQCYGTIWG